MKVCILTHFWKHGSTGGIKNYAVNLVNEFLQRGIQVDVIFTYGLDKSNYQVSPNKLVAILQTFSILLKIKPDVIHSQETWHLTLAGYLYKLFFGAKVIHTIHSDPIWKMTFFNKIIYPRLLQACNCVTFVSQGLQTKMIRERRLVLDNIEVTYAGVHQPRVNPEELNEFKDRFEIPDTAILLVGLGLTALKYKAEGAKLLIQAVKQLSRHYPHLYLILTRQARFTPVLKKYAQAIGVDHRVVFTGTLPNSMVPLILCTIYTHISLGEGLPLAILEAMILGKPIVATAVGGIPEAITHQKSGLLVEPHVDAITASIKYLIEHPDIARQLGFTAQQVAHDTFTWTKSADAFLSLYHRY